MRTSAGPLLSGWGQYFPTLPAFFVVYLSISVHCEEQISHVKWQKQHHGQSYESGCKLQSIAHLDCRFSQWNQDGTCTYWVPRSLHAYSQAGTQLVKGGFRREETDQRSALEDYVYQIRMTKHLILLLFDFHNPLAVNLLPSYSKKTRCLIHIGNVCVSPCVTVILSLTNDSGKAIFS